MIVLDKMVRWGIIEYMVEQWLCVLFISQIKSTSKEDTQQGADG